MLAPPTIVVAKTSSCDTGFFLPTGPARQNKSNFQRYKSCCSFYFAFPWKSVGIGHIWLLKMYSSKNTVLIFKMSNSSFVNWTIPQYKARVEVELRVGRILVCGPWECGLHTFNLKLTHACQAFFHNNKIIHSSEQFSFLSSCQSVISFLFFPKHAATDDGE